MNPRTVALAFRAVAVAEALSWLGLLAGMYVKYVPETTELGVQVFGPIHGGIFVAYVVAALVAARSLRWSLGTTLLALVASIPPLASVVFERWGAGGPLTAIRRSSTRQNSRRARPRTRPTPHAPDPARRGRRVAGVTAGDRLRAP